jgi:hypothetical protein
VIRVSGGEKEDKEIMLCVYLDGIIGIGEEVFFPFP